MADQIYEPNQSMDYNQGLSIAAEQEENQQKPGTNGFHNTYSDFNSEGFSTEIQQTMFTKQHEEQNPLPENLNSQYFENTQNHSENYEEQDPQKTMQENRNSMDTMLSNGDFMGTQEENGAENGEEKKNSEDGQGRGRRRKSRWGPGEGENNEGTGRKRKTRWADEPKPTNLGGLAFALPDFVKGLNGGLENDPEVQALNARLTKITTLLTSGLPLDEKPEGARSPSPEPIYDNNGIRINTREYRARERLTREKQEIIQQLIQKSPTFKPPADYRPPKLYKKLYIPVKEFPGYNFIGLIIGPRGNTQKRMEKETGAKIVIRGKGSVKEGKLQQQKRDFKPDPAENEDLHVLVEAETHDALEKAAGMLEKLLHPVDEVLNEHKRAQLKELAALNGTIRDEEFCRLCGEQGHRQYACPSKNSTFKSNVLCEICGDGGHPTIDCPVKNTGKKMDDEYQNFLQEVKAGGVPISTTEAKQQNHQTLAITGSGKEGLGYSNGSSGGFGMKFAKENDESNLYIGYLPPHIDDDGLISLFSPFGEIVACKVIKDRVTGQSKGYGFVKYSDTATAAQAILHMNGYRLDTRVIAVRVAGRPPQAGFPGQAPVPGTYPDPSGAYNSQQQFVPTPPSSTPIRAPVPWGPPVPPSSYNPYAPPVPYPQGGAYPNMMNPNPYASYQAVPPPPGVQPSVDQSQVLPPGVQPENANSDGAPPGTTNAENSATVSMPVSAPPVMPYYQPPPYQPPYVPPPPPPTAPAPTGPPPPWVTNTPPPPPPPPASTSDTAAYSDEYEKFMSEMGANI